MNPLVFAIVALVFGYPLFWLERRWHLKRVFEIGTKHLTDQVGELRAVLDDERAQKRRFQDKNLEIQAERDQWLKLYHDQSIGHGNAQNFMMEVIDQLGSKLTGAGIKFKVPGVIALMRQEFLQKHEAPSREALELLKKAQSVIAPGPELPPAA